MRINSIPLKKGMTAGACFKETQYPWKYYITAVGLLKYDGTTKYIGASAPVKRYTIRLGDPRSDKYTDKFLLTLGSVRLQV